MLLSALALALSLLGATPQALGLPTAFWCDDFAAKVEGQPVSDGPTDLLRKQVPFAATPGGIVGINTPQSSPDYSFHVAIIERTTPDGGVDVVEGNGADRDHVTRNHYAPTRITGTYVTSDAHAAYEHSLCLQLQEAKPWINWEC